MLSSRTRHALEIACYLVWSRAFKRQAVERALA
jgi:hypothetical protein